jgi:hypothetical protein
VDLNINKALGPWVVIDTNLYYLAKKTFKLHALFSLFGYISLKASLALHPGKKVAQNPQIVR